MKKLLIIFLSLTVFILAKTWEEEMISHLNGVELKLYKFYKGYFYYLIENLENEEYELHRIKI